MADRIERKQVQIPTAGEVALMVELMVERRERRIAPAGPGLGRC